jgi:5'-nucleotidase
MLVPTLHNVDIVIGGHTHTFVDDFVYVQDADGRAVPIITDGCWGYDIGEIILK